MLVKFKYALFNLQGTNCAQRTRYFNAWIISDLEVIMSVNIHRDVLVKFQSYHGINFGHEYTKQPMPKIIAGNSLNNNYLKWTNGEESALIYKKRTMHDINHSV